MRLRSSRDTAASSLAARLPRALLLVGVALTGVGCAAPPTEQPPPECENRGETIAVGMRKTTEHGLNTVELVEATLPPLQGGNTWTVEVQTSEGEPVLDLIECEPGLACPDENDFEVIAAIYMADHDHNLRKSAVMTSPGIFEVPEFLITMSGYWEVTIVVRSDQATDPDEHEDAVFGFCVPN